MKAHPVLQHVCERKHCALLGLDQPERWICWWAVVPASGPFASLGTQEAPASLACPAGWSVDATHTRVPVPALHDNILHTVYTSAPFW